MLIYFFYHLHFALLRDAELLLLREAPLADALLREVLLLDDLDTEALLLLAELLRETLLFDTLLRELLDDTEGLVLLELLLLLDTLPFEPLLRDTLLVELLRVFDDTLLLLEVLLLVREPVTEVEPLRELLDELLRDTFPFEEELREEELGFIAVRRFSSESTFTLRLSLSREGTFTNPDLRSRLLFS